jgi:hypothetical protein
VHAPHLTSLSIIMFQRRGDPVVGIRLPKQSGDKGPARPGEDWSLINAQLFDLLKSRNSLQAFSFLGRFLTLPSRQPNALSNPFKELRGSGTAIFISFEVPGLAEPQPSKTFTFIL